MTTSLARGARCGVLAATLLAASCAGVATQPVDDRLCEELARFAVATQPGTTSSVKLTAGWGGEPDAGEPGMDVLMTKRCEHGGTEHGVALCKYLMPNTSWEFGNRNASRAVACLDANERNALRRKLETAPDDFELASTLRRVDDKSVRVTLRYRSVPDTAHDELVVSVTRAAGP